MFWGTGVHYRGTCIRSTQKNKTQKNTPIKSGFNLVPWMILSHNEAVLRQLRLFQLSSLARQTLRDLFRSIYFDERTKERLCPLHVCFYGAKGDWVAKHSASSRKLFEEFLLFCRSTYDIEGLLSSR